ncbi:MAG: hypothetical protein Q8O31_00620 [Rhodocyclaceae bacterium]|nr:hypothetical protein [Rhodocyclaceae bacterium]
MKHHFIIIIPVADRPQHLKNCFDSLLEHCRLFDVPPSHLRLFIVEDSTNPAHIHAHRQLAQIMSQKGLDVTHFCADEQFDLITSTRGQLNRIIGNPTHNGHKGQGVARNLAYLKLAQETLPENTLLWSIDSDQEFKVKIATEEGDQECFSVDYFHRLDEIFSTTDVQVLTGKVVGDPPVSPAVMTGNFLDDVIDFLQQTNAYQPHDPCPYHLAQIPEGGDAAYHDMADLFGFKLSRREWHYRCPLKGPHTVGECVAHFSEKLAGFFHGEHPTRITYYQDNDPTLQPARTVYAGNYVFRPAALKYFLPFAPLRLRMSGPTLGRLIRAQIGPRFVSANLPMLHRRTLDTEVQSGFRPGIETTGTLIDMSNEFERQFQGDVMLFTLERLTAQGFPDLPFSETTLAETLEAVTVDMQARYHTRRLSILEKLNRLKPLLNKPAQRIFADNIAHNFGINPAPTAPPTHPWRAQCLEAIARYPEDSSTWFGCLH